MPISPAVGVEPIPGYQLVERLGTGGYGEVWKVTAPGGLFKAMKFIFGDMAGPRADQELKSLERIKSVRHPFLLSLEQVKIVEGHLLIVTELADNTLLDRFRECRAAGLPGIPREELLIYLRDVADALDYMAETHALQHLDIKPQNLLLVSKRVKVADFGLVKDLMGSSASITGGITPVYASPEAFDGRVSRYSDQYSLAIVYQEMLTGQRPFPGTTAYQLANQHTTAPPMLGSLPEEDRRIIGRALSKVPEQRYPSCRVLVEELLAARRGSGLQTPVPAITPPPSPAPAPPSPPPALDQLLEMDTLARGEVSGPPVSLREAQTPIRQETPQEIPTRPRPTLFLGLGGLGGRVLTLLKRRLARRLGEGREMALFRLLLLDVDRAALRQAQQAGLDSGQVLACPLHPPEHYRERAASLFRWLPRRFLHNIPRSFQTEGLRPLGRLALVENAPAVLASLRENLRALLDPSLSSLPPRVVIVAAITGGTGGGMLIDAACAATQTLLELDLSEGPLAVLAHVSGPAADQRIRAQVNAHATLSELQRWSRAGAPYPGDPERGLQAATRPLLADVYLLRPRPGQPYDDRENLAGLLAEYLFFEAVEAGNCVQRLRAASRSQTGPIVRSFGLARLEFPRDELIDWTARRICPQIIESWAGRLAPADREPLLRAGDQLAREGGLTEEQLQRLFHKSLEAILGEPAETAFNRLAESTRATGETLTPGNPAAAQMLETLDGWLGTGDDGNMGLTPPLAQAGFRDRARSLAQDLGRQALDQVLKVVEKPGQRLQAAELLLTGLTLRLKDELANVETRQAQLRSARTSLRQRLQGTPPGKSSPALAVLRLFRADLNQADRLLWYYYCVRLEELLEEAVQGVLSDVLGLANRLAQEMAVARQKLADFAAAFGDPPDSATQPASLALTELFPFGVENLEAAGQALLEHLPPDLQGQIEAAHQAEVLDVGGGLWAMLSGRADMARLTQSQSPASLAFWNLVTRNEGLTEGLRNSLLLRVQTTLREFLKELNLASLLLQRHGDGRQAIRSLVESAAPVSATPSPWHHLILAIPNGKQSQELTRDALEELAGEPLTLLPGGASLVAVVEQAGTLLDQVTIELAGNDPELLVLSRQLRTRADVSWDT